MSTDAKPKTGSARTWIGWIKRAALVLLVGLLLASGVALVFAWVPMGEAPDGERKARMEASEQWGDGTFVNPQPMYNDYTGWLTNTSASDYASPDTPLPVVDDTLATLKTPPESARITWLGHSTTLIEIGGKRVLTDPIFGSSPSPYSLLGPQRWYAPPVSLEALGELGVDIVLISHDHYDHLDYPTMADMKGWEETTFIVPLGVGAHLEYWGIPAEQIIELDWWEERTFGDLRIAATPARHASGRQILDQNRTLWASYALIGPEHRVMFSGDTGLFDDMKTIGEKYGPFDVVMIEVGAYHRSWPDWHIGPEQAILGHQWMDGATFMPIHWGLFDLAMHGWTEPIERTWAAASAAGESFVAPRPGESFDVTNPPEPTRWWPDVPWETASEHPVISTKDGNPENRYPMPDWASDL
jgi:L-ascorbate metabolism protein UlaG (beta-lactamase superfamily)